MPELIPSSSPSSSSPPVSTFDVAHTAVGQQKVRFAKRHDRRPRRPYRPETRYDNTTEVFARAVNGDNHHDADRLVELFRHHYGDEHPFPDVYDSKYWLDLYQTRSEPGGMVSLVAEENDGFSAHLGLDYNSKTRTVELLLPAIHPQCRHRMFSILRAFWARIARTAERQHWDLIFSNNPTSQPMLQLLAAKCFNSEASALIPLKSSSESDHRSELFLDSLVLMLNVMSKKRDGIPTIYPPPAHSRFIISLLTGLGTQRKVNRGQSSAAAYSSSATVDRKRQRSLLLRYEKRFRMFQLRITPSSLGDFAEAYERIDRLERRGASLVLFVSMRDPACPEFCSVLEQIGYRFCGIFPFCGKDDAIAYTRFDNAQIEKLTLYTLQAKRLRQYLLEHTKLT